MIALLKNKKNSTFNNTVSQAIWRASFLRMIPGSFSAILEVALSSCEAHAMGRSSCENFCLQKKYTLFYLYSK